MFMRPSAFVEARTLPGTPVMACAYRVPHENKHPGKKFCDLHDMAVACFGVRGLRRWR